MAPPERPEWHLAVDGQQKGPFTKAQLAAQVLAQKPDAESFVWKDGMDGWKEPAKVPEIERALAQAKQGRPLPPRPPTSPSLPVAAKPLAALASSVSKPGHSAPAISAGDHLGSFDEGEATQIQPLSGMLANELLGGGDGEGLLEDDDDDGKTPIAHLAPAHKDTNGAAFGTNGAGHPPARPPLDLFSDAPSTPFFPPPSATQVAGRQVAPAPHMSMGAGESGLSKVMGLGGNVSRKPWVKKLALAAAFLLIAGAVSMAIRGGSTTPVVPKDDKEPGTEPGARTAAEVEKAAEDEAKKWFPDQPGQEKVAHVAGTPRPAATGGKKPAVGSKPGVDPTAPPPVDPAAATETKTDTTERKVDFGLAERRPVVGGKKPAAAPPVNQAAIGNVVRRKENQDAVKLCYNRVLRRTGAQTGGRIQVTVNIGLSGKVKSVDLNSPPDLQPVHDCLKQAVNRWRFPAGPEEYETGFTLVLSGS